jgi:hypothetical protein
MSQTIVLKRSALPGKVPDTGSLNLGEIAINTYDGKVFLKRSGSVESIQALVTTDSITTGSITLTQSGSFGELVVTQDANITRDLFVSRDIITNGDIDVLGDITGSNLLIYGTITARQMVISSSVTNMTTQFASGSTSFGNTIDDTHTFTGSINITGSLFLNGNDIGQASGGSGSFTGSFSGYFIGDGSQLINIPGELPLNNFDFNIPDGASILDFSNESPSYIVDFQREQIVGSAIGLKGYISNASGSTAILPTDDAVQFFVQDTYVGGFTTSSLYFINDITASVYSGSVYGIGNPLAFSQSLDSRITSLATSAGYASSASFNSFTSSYILDSASFDSRIIAATNEGQFATTGSNYFVAQQYISGNINITGSIIPSGSASFDLGNETNPWRHLYISTGSIKFIGANNEEVARINVNKTSGQITLLSTAGLDSASIAAIETGSTSNYLSEISASNLYVSGAVQIGYSLTQTYMLESSVLNNNTISTVNTGSYMGAFYNYTLSKGVNARAGQMMAVWNNGGISFTETLTTDIGDTSDVSFNAALNGGSVQLVANTAAPGWKIRLIQQFI